MDNSNVVPIGLPTPITVEEILDKAKKELGDTVVVIGYTEDDDVYVAHNTAPITVTWLLELTKKIVLDYALE